MISADSIVRQKAMARDGAPSVCANRIRIDPEEIARTPTPSTRYCICRDGALFSDGLISDSSRASRRPMDSSKLLIKSIALDSCLLLYYLSQTVYNGSGFGDISTLWSALTAPSGDKLISR